MLSIYKQIWKQSKCTCSFIQEIDKQHASLRVTFFNAEDKIAKSIKGGLTIRIQDSHLSSIIFNSCEPLCTPTKVTKSADLIESEAISKSVGLWTKRKFLNWRLFATYKKENNLNCIQIEKLHKHDPSMSPKILI